MATTTPNIGLTKPVGTEFVSLGIINENYDKIDAAFGNIDVNGLIKTILYTASNITVNPNNIINIDASDFGISDVAGYTPIAPVFYDSGSPDVAITWLNAAATDERTAMRLRNVSNTAQTCSPQIKITYVKSSFVAS